MGCWLGKAVGGTLGQTFEGMEGPLSADFYLPVPTTMVPNDDLDLQVVYACLIDAMPEPRVDRHVLAEGWLRHVEFPWNEYGVGLRNVREGIQPPHSGSFDNWFTCGEGAAIRSELWACLAPGDPDLAQAYAYEDACFDHAGDGLIAALFLARLQAAAFTESDPRTLIATALRHLPDNGGRIARVVTDTLAWIDEGLDWRAVRERIVERYGNDDFTDVRINTGFVITGWLLGRDFSERILICNNCGGDCDSSTATIGALLGILDPAGIDERWLAPIGRDLVLNDQIIGLDHPDTLDGFTDLVESLRDRLGEHVPPQTAPFDPADHAIPVRRGFTNTEYGKWTVRDQTELPPIGAPELTKVDLTETTVPGTWIRIPRSDFADKILVLEYSLDGRGTEAVRLMIQCTEHVRAWLDGEMIHAAQGSTYQFPAPHMPPIGQYQDFTLAPGAHRLRLAIKRPPVHRDTAELVVALVDQHSKQWIPHAFRPDRALDAPTA
jgi:ADP-ribosylglycohydrolase